MSPSEFHLTTKEASERLRLAESTLKNWRVSGGGPRFVKFGRKVLYPMSELEAYEAKNLHSANSVLAADATEGRKP